MKKTFKIITLGCKVNQYESAYLNSRLCEAGWTPVKENQPSDVSIINTCIVTRSASHQSRQEIRKAIRENPEGYIGAIGCYEQAFPGELRRIEGLHLVVGNKGKGRVPDILRSAVHSKDLTVVQDAFTPGMPFEPMDISTFPGRSRAYLKIQDGCESYCSYCIVPFSRGPYRSLSPKDILRMLENLAGEGYREVVLTGIHLGKYGVDLAGNLDLKGLLRAIRREALPFRIRLSSLEPGEMDEELIEMVGSEAWICRHFHIPLQSGDDEVLKRMNRRYSARAFEQKIKYIRQIIPAAAIGVDVMAGFPGEGELAHSNTLSLLRDLPVSYLHVFPFSRRPGTVATGFSGQVPPQERRKRAAQLRVVGEEKRGAFYEGSVGGVFQVLVEGWHSEKQGILKGTSDNYLPTVFPRSGPGMNGLVSVRVQRAKENMVVGIEA